MNQVMPVILAGGLGSRLRHVAPNLPKPMVEVAGAPFLEWVLRYLEANGLDRFVISTGYRGEVIEEYAAARDGGRGRIQCVRETTPLGTGGAFVHAARMSTASPQPEAWLVLNGDSVVLAPLAPLLALADEPDWQGGLIGIPVPDTSRYGSLEVDDTGALTRFKEKQPGSGLINAGVYLLKGDLIASTPEGQRLSMEEDLFPDFLKRPARLRVHATDAPFIDMGTPESLALAEGFIRANQSFFER